MRLPATLTLWPYLLVLASGSIWGITFSLARIATEAGSHPLGLTFWQGAGGGSVLLIFCCVRGLARRRNGQTSVGVARERVTFTAVVFVAIFGNALPGALLFYAAPHVPAGLLAITIALVPLLTYAASLVFGLDRFAARRVSGVAFGFVAIVLIMLPDTRLPSSTGSPDNPMEVWILLALLASCFYTMENIFVDRVVPANIDITFLLMLAMFASAIIILPVIVIQDAFVVISFPFDAADWSILTMMVVSSLAYLMYLYLIQNAGAVFASMSGYIVTLSGVFWGILFFNEQHTAGIWSALIFMLAGMILVSPRTRESSDHQP